MQANEWAAVGWANLRQPADAFDTTAAATCASMAELPCTLLVCISSMQRLRAHPRSHGRRRSSIVARDWRWQTDRICSLAASLLSSSVAQLTFRGASVFK